MYEFKTVPAFVFTYSRYIVWVVDMVDILPFYQVEHRFCTDLSQEEGGATSIGEGPGKAPPIAMEHGNH